MKQLDMNFFGCIKPLLEAFGWHGSPRRIFESVPYLQDYMNLIDLRNMMANLGYVSKKKFCALSQIDQNNLPCLFINSTKKNLFVVHNRTNTDFIVTNCLTGEVQAIPLETFLKGELISFYREANVSDVSSKSKSWIMTVASRFNYLFWPLFWWTFFITILSLMLPLFVRSIYDYVIPTQSKETLTFLGLGLLMGLFCMHLIHLAKERVVAYIGARVDMIIGSEVMRKILFLPIPYSEGSSVAAQVTRLKQYDTIRDLFTGPFFQIMIDAPFLILYVITLAVIAGPLALIPLFVIGIYVILSFLFFPLLRDSTNKLSTALQKRRTFLIESISNLKTIKLVGGETVWTNRLKEICSTLSFLQKDSDKVSNFASNISQILLKVSGVITIVWGAVRVMNGDMTVGSLIAVVLLIWRALTPIQTLFMFLSRFDQIMDTMGQLNRLMSIPSERRLLTSSELKFQGLIRLMNVGFRYPTESTMALQNVSMEAKPGEMIAIVGPNGAGKTTLIKLLLGFYPPQTGNITIDGVDTRQFDPIQLRQSIAYVPNQIQLFHGTIAQNLRLSVPEATDEALIKALESAGFESELRQLPLGINTPLTENMIHRFSSGFLQKINLARAYIRKSKIIILDEPGNTLDQQSDRQLMENIVSLKGKKTVLLITHRPSLVHLADRVLALYNGQMRVFGPKDKVLNVLAGNKL